MNLKVRKPFAWLRSGLGCLASFGLLCFVVHAADQPRVTEIDSTIQARLAKLNPSEPLRYFELAELISYEHADPFAQRLSRQLFVLAYELDRKRGGDLQLGESVCLALVDLAGDEADRQWLAALAEAMRTSSESSLLPTEQTAIEDPEAALLLAESMGAFRGQSMRIARDRARREKVASLLARFRSELDAAGYSLSRMEGSPLCEECRNRRAVRNPDNPEGEMSPCGSCGGNPGVSLSAEKLMRQLSLESRILQVEHRSWAAQLIVDDGAPLRDLDPRELVMWFDVDQNQPFWSMPNGEWRAGEWTAAPMESGSASED